MRDKLFAQNGVFFHPISTQNTPMALSPTCLAFKVDPPICPIVRVILNVALTDPSDRHKPNFFDYFSKFLTTVHFGLLKRVLVVREKLAYAFAVSKSGGLAKIHDAVGREVWSYLGSPRHFPKIHQLEFKASKKHRITE